MRYEIHGENVSLMVQVDGVFFLVACETSCDIITEKEIIPSTGVNSGLFRQKRTRLTDSRVSFEGVATSRNEPGKLSVSYFQTQIVSGGLQTLRMVLTDQDGNDLIIDTTQFIKSVSIRGEVTAFAEFTIEFEGSGPIIVTELDLGESPGSAESPGGITPLYLQTVEGENTVQHDDLIGADMLHVEREGIGQTEVASGPTNAEFSFDTVTGTLTFDPAIPFNADEEIFVLYQ